MAFSDSERLRFAEAALSSSEEGVVLLDAEGHVFSTNQMAREMTRHNAAGDSSEEMAGGLMFCHTDGRPIPLDETPIARALRGESVADFYLIIRRPDGSALLARNTANPVRGKNGCLLGVTCILRPADVRDLPRGRQERRHLRKHIRDLSEETQRRADELQAILDNMVDSVFVCDDRARITLANEAGVSLLGLKSVDDLKRLLSGYPSFLKIRHPDGKPVAPSDMPLVRALRGQTVVDEEQIILNPLTQRDVHLRASAAPIRNANRRITGAVAVARDMTELTELEQLKERFISVAAHELKTPLAIMKGYAQTLLRLFPDLPQPGRRMLGAVDRGADRINGIVHDLLDISRLQEGSLELELERLDLLELAAGVVDAVSLSTAEHQINVAPGHPVHVTGDRERLEQVVNVLLDNALRYSPSGGQIDLLISLCREEAVLSVVDRGIGIPGEKQGRIFDRFYRAHTGTPYDYGGMGVSLYISREIVSRHGGRLWFESEEGQGSTFYMSLPSRGASAGS